jgi:hypothetical protein
MPSAAAAVTIAKGEIGQSEAPPGSNRCRYTRWYEDGRYGPAYSQGWAWCAIFLSWVADRNGLRLPAVDSQGGFHYVPSMRAFALDRGLTVATPTVGSLFLVTWDGSWGLNTHAGLVTKVRAGGDLDTVEGNISDMVVAGRRTPAPNFVFLTPDLFERDGNGDPRPKSGNRFAGYPTIRHGSRGGVVRTFQHSVNQIDADRRLVEDGDYGAKSEAACRDFQKIMGMVVDGVCGPLTWGALDFALDHAGF